MSLEFKSIKTSWKLIHFEKGYGVEQVKLKSQSNQKPIYMTTYSSIVHHKMFHFKCWHLQVKRNRYRYSDLAIELCDFSGWMFWFQLGYRCGHCEISRKSESKLKISTAFQSDQNANTTMSKWDYIFNWRKVQCFLHYAPLRSSKNWSVYMHVGWQPHKLLIREIENVITTFDCLSLNAQYVIGNWIWLLKCLVQITLNSDARARAQFGQWECFACDTLVCILADLQTMYVLLSDTVIYLS